MILKRIYSVSGLGRDDNITQFPFTEAWSSTRTIVLCPQYAYDNNTNLTYPNRLSFSWNTAYTILNIASVPDFTEGGCTFPLLIVEFY